MKNKYMPYSFDSKYEYRTYKNIGKDSKRLYQSQNNICYKLFYRMRSKIGGKRYTSLNTYSDWKIYVIGQIEDKLAYDQMYVDNFISYLNARKRKHKFEDGVIRSIAVPVYMALAAGATAILFPYFYKYNDISMIDSPIVPIALLWQFGLLLILMFLTVYNLNI